MFKILDGRENFYQWDLDRKLVVEDFSINQVHFTNRTHTNALVCEVIEGVVNVPNILLQEDWDIAVYAYDTNYTRYDEVFEVKARNKPDNYVYTETEVLNYNVLLDRINRVDENIENTVNEYLTENPPQVDLTGYATEEYVDSAIAAQPDYITEAEVVQNYVTKTDLNDRKYQNASQVNALIDARNYATKEEVPSLNGYATTSYVDKKVAAIPKTDLSNYYTMAQADNKFATKSEIPSTSGLATEKYVDDAIANLDIPEAEVDLTNYYTKSEVNDLIPDTTGFATIGEVEAKGYQTADQVTTAINNALGVIENGAY